MSAATAYCKRCGLHSYTFIVLQSGAQKSEMSLTLGRIQGVGRAGASGGFRGEPSSCLPVSVSRDHLQLLAGGPFCVLKARPAAFSNPFLSLSNLFPSSSLLL